MPKITSISCLSLNMPVRPGAFIRRLALLIGLFAPIHAMADDWAPGVPVGTPFPNIDAADQNGQTWTNKELVGDNGLVFFFMRSSNW